MRQSCTFGCSLPHLLVIASHSSQDLTKCLVSATAPTSARRCAYPTYLKAAPASHLGDRGVLAGRQPGQHHHIHAKPLSVTARNLLFDV
jgi:hypothetical protein